MKPLLTTALLLFIITISFSQNNPTTMEQRMSFITLGVENLSASADFYENKLGWKRTEMSNENIIFFQLNGILLSLYEKEKLAEDATVDAKGNGFKGFTLSYLTGSEKEVDDIIENLRKQGVKVVKAPQKVFWGGYHSYIADPDGYLWEIAFNPYLLPQ